MKRFLALLLAATGILQAQTQPNVILILTDDMGWGDLGIFWQNQRGTQPKFFTPELDAMAAQGLQLRRHYTAAPVCAPARASLLLGVHQGHSNVRDSQFDKELANNHTLGTVMQQAGYATASIGKWGLQGGSAFPGHPQNRGFDYFFGYMAHLDAHFHYPKEQNRAFYENFTDIRADLDKCYSTDLVTARTKNWIASHRSAHPDQPFFIYMCYPAPHAQLNVPTQAYPAGKGLAGGVQWTGTPGTMINTASGTTDSWIHPDYSGKEWPNSAKRHATMMRRIDDGVGDLLATLADLGIDHNTMVVFTSDNGPHNEAGSGGSFTQNPRYFGSYGPLEGIKRDVLDGGLRVPALVRWPGTIAAGGVSQLPSQFHDWLPTLADIAGLSVPARSDGTSLKPLLTGIGTQRMPLVYSEFSQNGSTPNYTEFPNNGGSPRNQMQAIFLDGYKGLRTSVADANTAFRVFDTENDPGEGTNLAAQPGIPSQADFAAAALRSRRANSTAVRPYDSALVPAVTLPQVTPGLAYRVFEKATTWVPDWRTETAAADGTVTSPDLSVRTRDSDIGLLFTGYLQVPADGTYTFYTTTDTGVFVRLHDAQLIDADFGYTGGTEKSSGTIPLQAGLHPIHIHYRHSNAASHTLDLQWQGPGITKQAIPAGNFLIEGTPVPGPPKAEDDAANTSYETSVLIDVLANDTDDGTPTPLSITNISTPDFGSAVLEAGKIRFTPPAAFSGISTFTYVASDGAENDTATVTVTVSPLVLPTFNLWTTIFTGEDGTNRNLINTNGDPSFTDTLTADDANLTFEDTTFTGTIFMHSGTMSNGTYYSPRTNVDNPTAAPPQNGGWWQSEFRYAGGSQNIVLSEVVLRMVWSNSGGNLQGGDANARDITLTAEYSLNEGTDWADISLPQTYRLTVNPGTAEQQHQNRTFTFESPLSIDHSTQDLWLRVRAENAGSTAGAYVNIRSITFQGNVSGLENDYTTWAALYSSADLTDLDADADSDGLTNFDEYAFGLNPTDATSVSPVTVPDLSAGTFIYTRRKQSLTGFSYFYESSVNLDGWSSFTPPIPEASDDGDPSETITVTIPAALLTEPRFFLRVKATAP